MAESHTSPEGPLADQSFMVLSKISPSFSPPKAGGRITQGFIQPSIIRDQVLSSCGSGLVVADIAVQEAVELLVLLAYTSGKPSE